MANIKNKFTVGGKWILEVWENREAKDRGDAPKFSQEIHNVVTAEGINSLLNVYLHGATPITTWYCLLFESDTTPADGTTYATPVFTECTAYDEAARPVYNEAAASGKSITNSANKAEFTMSGTKTLYGAALVGGGTAASTKGNTDGGGTLFCGAKFPTAQPVIADNVVNLTYTVSGSDDGA